MWLNFEQGMAKHLGLRNKTIEDVWKQTREEGDERELEAAMEGTTDVLEKCGRIRNRALKCGGNIMTFMKTNEKEHVTASVVRADGHFDGAVGSNKTDTVAVWGRGPIWPTLFNTSLGLIGPQFFQF